MANKKRVIHFTPVYCRKLLRSTMHAYTGKPSAVKNLWRSIRGKYMRWSDTYLKMEV
jgi:hypothetical protein